MKDTYIKGLLCPLELKIPVREIKRRQINEIAADSGKCLYEENKIRRRASHRASGEFYCRCSVRESPSEKATFGARTEKGASPDVT